MVSKLTDAKLQGFKAPESGQVEHSDSDVPGLRVRIGTSGTKTFIIRRRVGGKLRNINLGRYGPRFGLAAARKKARNLISDIEAGKPVRTGVRKGTSGTIRALFPAYVDSKSALRTIGETERIFRKYILPELGDRMVEGVTRGEVSAVIDAIAVTAPSMARAVHAQLSAFYSWAMEGVDEIQINPCLNARRPKKAESRKRTLNDAELAALWAVTEGEAIPWGAGMRLLMLTGARREEVFSASRHEFDEGEALWTIPGARTKNGEPHEVPLSQLALDVLASVPPVEGSDLLFPTRTKAGAAERGASGFSKALARVRGDLADALAPAPVPHWTMHDIRRTVATGLQRLGVRFEVTEAVLNHVSGSRSGVAGVYQRHGWSTEKRDALDSWSAHLLALIKKQGCQA